MKKKDNSRDIALAAADLASDVKGLAITTLDLRLISSVADYFVIASGRSHIQVEAICDHVVEGVRDRLGARPIAVEGLENSQWAILDYGSVVIHVFQESFRQLYDLEKLWSLAPRWNHEEGVPPPSEDDLKATAGKTVSAKKTTGKQVTTKATTARHVRTSAARERSSSTTVTSTNGAA